MANSQIENTITEIRKYSNALIPEVFGKIQKGTPDSKMGYHHISQNFSEIERKTWLQTK